MLEIVCKWTCNLPKNLEKIDNRVYKQNENIAQTSKILAKFNREKLNSLINNYGVSMGFY